MKKTDWTLPMNLQFFAEGGNGGNSGDNGAGSGDQQGAQGGQAGAGEGGSDNHDGDAGEADKPKYTDSQVNKLINQKFAEWQKRQEDKQAQAEKLKGLSDADRANEETKLAKSEAEKAKQELAAYQMRDTARKMFTAANVNVTDEDLGMVVTPEADSTKANVKQFLDFAKRVRAEAEHAFLSGDHLKVSGNKAGKAGNRGEEIAKANVSPAKKNPYFQN